MPPVLRFSPNGKIFGRDWENQPFRNQENDPERQEMSLSCKSIAGSLIQGHPRVSGFLSQVCITWANRFLTWAMSPWWERRGMGRHLLKPDLFSLGSHPQVTQSSSLPKIEATWGLHRVLSCYPEQPTVKENRSWVIHPPGHVHSVHTYTCKGDIYIHDHKPLAPQKYTEEL